MVETESISITRIKKSSLSKTNLNNLPFGKVFTDHMFMAHYHDGQWKNLRIVPYGPIQISPATPALHYGQSIFEGMKAYRAADGKALVFRAADNWKRMNISAERMCMPALPEDLFMDALSTIIDLDRDWIPSQEGSSLYIRPFMFSAVVGDSILTEILQGIGSAQVVFADITRALRGFPCTQIPAGRRSSLPQKNRMRVRKLSKLRKPRALALMA